MQYLTISAFCKTGFILLDRTKKSKMLVKLGVQRGRRRGVRALSSHLALPARTPLLLPLWTPATQANECQAEHIAIWREGNVCHNVVPRLLRTIGRVVLRRLAYRTIRELIYSTSRQSFFFTWSIESNVAKVFRLNLLRASEFLARQSHAPLY